MLLSLPFHHNWTDIPPRRHPALPIHLPLWPTFCAVVLLHWLLSLGWSLGIRDRQRFSLAGISYVTLVGVLGTFFAGLGGEFASQPLHGKLPDELLSYCNQYGVL